MGGGAQQKKLELPILVVYLHPFAKQIPPLEYIHIEVENIVSQGWDNQVSMITVSVVGHLLREIDLIKWRHGVHAYIGHIKGEEKNMADAAFRKTNFP